MITNAKQFNTVSKFERGGKMEKNEFSVVDKGAVFWLSLS